MAFKRSAVRSRLAPPGILKTNRQFFPCLNIMNKTSGLFASVLSHKIVPCAVSLSLLSGCTWFSFSTNVDPENFREYFKASGVSEITRAQMASLDAYDDLGMVESSDCMETEDDAAPSKGVAMKTLLEQASDKGADAVAGAKCVTVTDTLKCKEEITCYAQAIKAGKENLRALESKSDN